MNNTIPYYCLFFAVIMPYIIATCSVYYRKAQFGSINDKQPRAQANQLEGAGARVVAAQCNAWEALIVFAIALHTATLAGVDPQSMTQASLIFVGARILHPIFYVADIAMLRSLSFIIGFGSCLYLLGKAVF